VLAPRIAGIMNTVDVVLADLARPDHQAAVVALIDAYSQDPMGEGKPLAPEVRAQLIPGLRQHPTTTIFLAYVAGQPVGIAACFLGFSTFKAKPLLNIHDLSVLPAYRGRGVGAALLAAVERRARELGCCKLTLEVFENNRARHLYTRAGFLQAQYQEMAGPALFFSKSICEAS
jgi:GNAT superfamily N-acetyltransferase